MKLRFLDKGHKYQSDNNIKWTSVTKLIHKYENPFNSKSQAYASSLNPNSKWFGMEIKDILSVWAKENRRSTIAGHWYHNRMEKKAIETEFKEYKSHKLQVFKPKYVKNYKLARDQRLEPGIYPEHMVYSTDYAVCGQVDLPYIYDRYVDILDYKTNKEIKFEGYGGKMMRYGLKHLPDANFYHYSLQLSVYMRLILMANPHLKPGEMKIYHVTFKNDGYDEFGFPILKQDAEKNYLPNKGKYYKVPYLEKEAIYMLKNNIAG